jgi:hypothetical protein
MFFVPIEEKFVFFVPTGEKFVFFGRDRPFYPMHFISRFFTKKSGNGKRRQPWYI